MTSIGNGVGRVNAKREAIGRSLRILEDEVYEQGYEPDDRFIRPASKGRFRATAWTVGSDGKRYRAEAIGNTAVGAAQSLVRSLRLPYRSK